MIHHLNIICILTSPFNAVPRRRRVERVDLEHAFAEISVAPMISHIRRGIFQVWEPFQNRVRISSFTDLQMTEFGPRLSTLTCLSPGCCDSQKTASKRTKRRNRGASPGQDSESTNWRRSTRKHAVLPRRGYLLIAIPTGCCGASERDGSPECRGVCSCERD